MDYKNNNICNFAGITMHYSIFKNAIHHHEIGRRKGCASVFLEG